MSVVLQRPQSYDNVLPKEDMSFRDCESVSDSLCAEEFEQPSPISILESPFQDSASSSSDGFEASHGRTQWEANANELFDCVNMLGKQFEAVKMQKPLTLGDGYKFTDVTCSVGCIDPGALDVHDTVLENEDECVKTLEAVVFSAVRERLVLSGVLLDPAASYQLKIQIEHFTRRATSPSNLCMENDSEFSSCRRRICRSLTRGCREFALQKRELLFDCIEEALRLNLEKARQSYGFSVPCMQLPAAYCMQGVYKQIDEWKGLAISMNLDDMMKMEVNTGMGRWFKLGDEVEKLAENIETMIVRSLMDELMEVVIETPALFVCS